ncbi:MAG: MarR family winged helix-turn-helix transcriptional regulator [Spirochaetia bacterium]
MKDANTPIEKELSAWSDRTTQLSIRYSYLFFRDRLLSHSQVIVLHFLQGNGSSTVSDIGRALSVSNPAASQMLDDLVNRKYVSRREKEEDRRVRLHELTAKGTELLHQARAARQQWQPGLINSLTGEEKQFVGKALALLNKKLSSLEEHHDVHGPGCGKGISNDKNT